jgi:hypothetical protein
MNKKIIAVKLSKQPTKNGFVQVRLKNGQFAWVKQDKELKPWWMLDVIV